MRKTAIWRDCIAVAVAVIGGIMLASLLGNGNEDGPSSSPSSAGPPLSKYEEIPLRGEGASDVAEEVALDGGRVIAAAQAGKVRLFFFSERKGKGCGVYVTSPDPRKEEGTINIGAGVPGPEWGDDGMPGGPYMSASANGLAKPSSWASLSCAKGAMYVEYDSEKRARPTDPTGPVAAANSAKNPARSVFVVGREATRQVVLKKLVGS